MLFLHAMLVMSGSTIIVGLNGALQKRFILPDNVNLVPGDVHRAKFVQTGLGGKGQDVATTLKCIEFDSSLQLAQFVGSDSSGDEVYQLLINKLGKQCMELTIRTQSAMRICTSIVGSDETTELVEPSGVVTSDDMARLIARLKSYKIPNTALCIMGSMPPGCKDDTYAEIYKLVSTPSTLCLVDSVYGTAPLLRTMATVDNRGSNLFKMNASELCKLANVKKSTSETGGVIPEELIDGVKGFIGSYAPFSSKLKGLAITDGKHPAHFVAFTKGEVIVFKFPVPVLNVDALLYPVGAGDSVAAGILSAWRSLSNEADGSAASSTAMDALRSFIARKALADLDPEIRRMMAAFAFGIACGSASCLEEENSVLKLDIVLELMKTTDDPEMLSKLPF